MRDRTGLTLWRPGPVQYRTKKCTANLFQGVGTLVSHETQHFIWSTTMFLPINSFSNTILLQMSFGFYTKFSRFPGIFDPKRSHLDLGSLQSHSSSLRDRPQPTTSVHHAWNMMEGKVSTREIIHVWLRCVKIIVLLRLKINILNPKKFVVWVDVSPKR